MSFSKVRFGILGCASIARKLSRAITLSPNATVHAVASRSADKATKFVNDNGLPTSVKVYGSYEALVEDPKVDAVYIPIPTNFHTKWVTIAAAKKKHVLLEKPVALNVKDFDVMAERCSQNGVQLMDATMWMHHPRTSKMKDFILDDSRFGHFTSAHSIFTFAPGPDFFKNDIRVKPDLDALGALGDMGWYCIRSLLFVSNYELPKKVLALPGSVSNEAGVILSCGASLHWEDGKVATFHCSFLSNLAMDISAVGTKGTLHVNDFIIPFQEHEASFSASSNLKLNDMETGWVSTHYEHNADVVRTDVPQEVIMVTKFANLVKDIKTNGAKPDTKWPTFSRKTQLIIDAVKASIDGGFVPVQVAS